MITFILPNPLINYLESKFQDQSQTKAIEKKLMDMIHSNSRLTKKNNGSRQVFYTFDINYGRYAHRAIFEEVDFQGQSCFLLRDIAWAHNYRKALSWTSYHTIDDRQLQDLFEGNYDLISSRAVTDMGPGDRWEEESFVRLNNHAVYYNGSWLTLNPEQQSLQEEVSKPSLLIGPPGCGKTLMAMSKMQERALEHSDSKANYSLKLLYITESPRLVKELKKQWSAFERQSLPQNYSKVIATFLTMKEYSEWYANICNLKLSENEPSQLTSEEYLELVHNAYYLDKDTRNNIPFEASEYQQVGLRNSVFDKSERSTLYKKFATTLSNFRRENLFHPNISSMHEVPYDYRYDFILVDEAQKASLSFLIGMMYASKGQVLYFGDSIQKGHSCFSTLGALGSSIHSAFNKELTLNYLHQTLRLKPDVAKLTNSLVLLKSNLKGGKTDAVSYSEISMPEATTQTQSIFVLDELNDEAKNGLLALGADAEAAAIIIDDKDREKAKGIINGPSVFTAEEARGLEFSRTLLYITANTLQRFKKTSTAMDEKEINFQTTLLALNNQSPDKSQKDDEVMGLLSDLIVAVSRTQNNLYVLVEPPKNLHVIQSFYNWLMMTLGTPIKSVVIGQKQSTEEDWLSTLHSYIDAKAYRQSHEILLSKFNLTELEAKKYIEFYQQQTNVTLESFIDWRSNFRTQQKSLSKAKSGSEDTPPKPSAAVTKVSEPTPSPVTSTQSKLPIETQNKINESFNKLKEDFNLQRWGVFIKVMPILDPAFWTSNAANELAVFLEANREAQQICYSYYINNPIEVVFKTLKDLQLCCERNNAMNLSKNLERIKSICDESTKMGLQRQIPYLQRKALIHLAIAFGKNEYFSFLHKLGANLNLEDGEGLTLGFVAALEGNNFVLRKLKELGVNLLQGTHNAVEGAIEGNKTETLRLLHKLDVNINQANYLGITPLHITANLNNTKMMKLLVELGGNINARDNEGITPARVSAEFGTPATLKCLKDLGADLNQGDLSGCTPFNTAAQVGKFDNLVALKKLGVDIEQADEEGYTAVHIATGSEKLLGVLRDLGANLNKRNNIGYTAAYIAASYNQIQILKLLKEYGADLSIPDHNGFTPAFLAAEKGYTSIIELLIEAKCVSPVKIMRKILIDYFKNSDHEKIIINALEFNNIIQDDAVVEIPIKDIAAINQNQNIVNLLVNAEKPEEGRTINTNNSLLLLSSIFRPVNNIESVTEETDHKISKV